MLPPNPPFPRRGIPSRKVGLPARREPPRPFLRTPMGRRMILYAVGLLAALGMLVSTVTKVSRPLPQGTESRPESRTVALTAPPKSFAPSDLLHQLVSVQDYSLKPNDGAIAACVQHLENLDVRATTWTDLDIEQAIAHPAAFRGGYVRIKGYLLRIETRALDHPTLPEGVLYEGLFIGREGRENFPLQWATKVPPREVDKNAYLEGEGIFVQTVQYEDKKGIIREAPFVVLKTLHVPAAEPPKGILDSLFGPTIIVLIILIFVTTLYLVRKSRRPAPSGRFVVRPPGPGR